MGYGCVQVLVKGACRLSQDPSLLRGRVGMLQGGSRTTQCEVCNLTLLQPVLPRANQSVSSVLPEWFRFGAACTPAFACNHI